MLANRQRTDVTGPLSRRSWGGMRDKPKNVCVGGSVGSDGSFFNLARLRAKTKVR